MTKAERRDLLEKYLYMKYLEKDWHAVSDAANDLRVLDAEIATETPREEAKHEEIQLHDH